jgi:hypothetical protein
MWTSTFTKAMTAQRRMLCCMVDPKGSWTVMALLG